MQREIKFRAWDKLIKKFYSDNEDLYVCHDKIFFKSRDKNNKYTLSISNAHCDYSQYTGLKDKNGVEIYEGDIVQTVAPDGVRLSKFRIFWSEAGCRFMKHREDDNFFELDIHQTLLEVIGNIYEHQNILT